MLEQEADVAELIDVHLLSQKWHFSCNEPVRTSEPAPHSQGHRCWVPATRSKKGTGQLVMLHGKSILHVRKPAQGFVSIAWCLDTWDRQQARGKELAASVINAKSEWKQKTPQSPMPAATAKKHGSLPVTKNSGSPKTGRLCPNYLWLHAVLVVTSVGESVRSRLPTLGLEV